MKNQPFIIYIIWKLFEYITNGFYEKEKKTEKIGMSFYSDNN